MKIGRSVRSATLVVAANDSEVKSKAQADYVCDGTDDHEQIQAAIDALPASGGEVFLLEGTYYIEASLVLDSYQTLRGCGRNTILTTTTASLYFITATGSDGSEKIGIFITDLCIDGADIAEDGIYWIYVDYSKIFNIWVKDVPDWTALWIQTCDHNEIIGNTFQNCYDGIYLSTSNDNAISENICQGCIEGIGLASSNGNIISGNICQGNDVGIGFDGSSNNTISGNNCRRSKYEGIYLYASSDHNIISGNACLENSAGIDNIRDNIKIADSDYNLIESNICRAPTIGTTLTTGESAAATDIHVTTTDGFEVGMGVVIDLGGVNIEYHRISAITSGTPGVITIDAGLTHDQGAGETIDVPEAKYGINNAGGCIGNEIINNDLYDSGKTANFNDDGTGTKLAVYVVPFSHGSDPQDSGFLIDADAEMARTWLRLPDKVVQVVRMKVYARSGALEADKMRAEFVIYGGADNEGYQTHNGSVANHPSTSANFAADDVIYWTITEAGVLALLGGDSVEVKVLHEAAGNGDIATNAYFRTVEIEYV